MIGATIVERNNGSSKEPGQPINVSDMKGKRNVRDSY